MKNLEVIIMLPLATLSLLLLMAIDLVRVAQGKPTADEDWHRDYVDSQLNHGQGRGGKNERKSKNYVYADRHHGNSLRDGILGISCAQ